MPDALVADLPPALSEVYPPVPHLDKDLSNLHEWMSTHPRAVPPPCASLWNAEAPVMTPRVRARVRARAKGDGKGSSSLSDKGKGKGKCNKYN